MSTFAWCPCCLDAQIPSDQFVTVVPGDRLCFECFNRGIKPDFVAAFSHEFNHPVYHYGHILDINNFASFFSPEFLTAYHLKLQEYAVPVPDRLYCNSATQQVCGQFMGSKATSLSPMVLCSSCSTPGDPVHICTQCSNSFHGDVNNHTCQSDQDPLSQLTRGVHYQVCPNEACEAKIELSAACNSMTCTMCRSRFCFICGSFPEPGHFSIGLCPHWGLKGSGAAIYDRPIVEQPIEVGLTPAREMEQLLLNHQRPLRRLDIGRLIDEPFARDLGWLAILLDDEIEIYVTLWNPELDRFQQDEQHVWAHDQIVEVAGRLPQEVWNALPQLFTIFGTYRNAWDGIMDDRGVVVQP